MNTPAITWRLRKIGRNLWSSMRARTARDWLSVHATRTPVIGRAAVKPPGPKPAPADAPGGDERASPAVRRTPRAWLSALPLDDSSRYLSPISAKQSG